MGQAKKRGPREVRVQQAIERDAALEILRKQDEERRLEARRREMEADPEKARRMSRAGLLLAAAGILGATPRFE